MGLLDRLEQSIERLLEGTTGSLFRQRLQPVEIGKQLERAMLSNQQVSVNTRLVPNVYEVRLNPKDFAQFVSYKDGLSRQLEAALAETASRHGLTALGRIQVTFAEDQDTGVRRPEIIAEMTDRPAQPRPDARRRHGRDRRPVMPSRTVEQTGVIDVPSRSSASAQRMALYIDRGRLAGQSFLLADGSTTIGRSSDNAIVLNEPDVSRRHARIERSGHYLRIFDLNSTNGTWINGEAVHISDLQPGDRIRLGSQELSLGTASGDDERRRWW